MCRIRRRKSDDFGNKSRFFIIIHIKTDIIRVVLVCLNGLLQQCQSLCLLLTAIYSSVRQFTQPELYIYCEMIDG